MLSEWEVGDAVKPHVQRPEDSRAQHAYEDDLQCVELWTVVVSCEDLGRCVHLRSLVCEFSWAWWTYNGAACLRDEDEAQPEVARIERMQVVAELAGAGFLSFFIDTVRIVDASARVCGPIVVCHFRLSLSFVRIEEAGSSTQPCNRNPD
jgi:hypothetical protein